MRGPVLFTSFAQALAVLPSADRLVHCQATVRFCIPHHMTRRGQLR